MQPALIPGPPSLTLTLREWTHWLTTCHPIEGCRVCLHVRRCVWAGQAGEPVRRTVDGVEVSP